MGREREREREREGGEGGGGGERGPSHVIASFQYR